MIIDTVFHSLKVIGILALIEIIGNTLVFVLNQKRVFKNSLYGKCCFWVSKMLFGYSPVC